MGRLVKEYKGYKIYKIKRDLYMELKNIDYMAYDENGDLFDGADTMENLMEKIDNAE